MCRELEETSRACSYQVAEHRPARSESIQPHTERSSRPGPEPPSVEADVYVWRYALLVAHARKEEEKCLPEQIFGLSDTSFYEPHTPSVIQPTILAVDFTNYLLDTSCSLAPLGPLVGTLSRRLRRSVARLL